METLYCRTKTALSSFILFSSLFKHCFSVDLKPENWLNCSVFPFQSLNSVLNKFVTLDCIFFFNETFFFALYCWWVFQQKNERTYSVEWNLYNCTMLTLAQSILLMYEVDRTKWEKIRRLTHINIIVTVVSRYYYAIALLLLMLLRYTELRQRNHRAQFTRLILR